MKFFEASELDDGFRARMAEYDRFIREKVGPDFAYPLRMRDWELDQVLQRLPQQPGDYILLETGSFNTYLGLWLARIGRRVVASDLFGERMKKSLLRQMGILPRKPTEAPFFAWMSAMKRAAENLELRTVNLTRMPYAAGTFDFITSISVVEHIPAVEKALAEMYRCLKPGGRLLLTTDCEAKGKGFEHGVRYFTPDELDRLFAPYPVTSERRKPDFRRENWCYDKDRPVLTAFVEITKPLS
ncbi:MAG: class I SAM-dependent methyltransferase [Verrucomicrobiota bacterium]|nr:class I SAM-dependent methyltransferase [Verrucomicrobiota bacterium]